jgi:hypothetical protein
MPTPKVLAFWSYAHEDDELTDGAIVALARSVSREDALVTGYPLEQAADVFVDCLSIGWGDDWRARIDQALMEASVLLPVLSPGYFLRPECRRELEAFLSRSPARIRPVLLLSIPNFSANNPDKLIARASQLQYVDWTDLRYAKPDDPDRKQAINRLVRGLRKAAISPMARQELLQILVSIKHLWPALREAVINLRITAAQYKATRDVLREERVAATTDEDAPDPRFHEATQLTPLEERCLAWAEAQLARLDDIDGLITKAIEIADGHTETRALLPPLREDIGQLKMTGPIGLIPQVESRSDLRLRDVLSGLADVAPRTETAIGLAHERVSQWRVGLGGMADSDEACG